MNSSIPLTEFIDDDYDIVVGVDGNGINCGSLFIRTSQFVDAFLALVYTRPLAEPVAWYEQVGCGGMAWSARGRAHAAGLFMPCHLLRLLLTRSGLCLPLVLPSIAPAGLLPPAGTGAACSCSPHQADLPRLLQ